MLAVDCLLAMLAATEKLTDRVIDAPSSSEASDRAAAALSPPGKWCGKRCTATVLAHGFVPVTLCSVCQNLMLLAITV